MSGSIYGDTYCIILIIRHVISFRWVQVGIWLVDQSARDNIEGISCITSFRTGCDISLWDHRLLLWYNESVPAQQYGIRHWRIESKWKSGKFRMNPRGIYWLNLQDVSHVSQIPKAFNYCAMVTGCRKRVFTRKFQFLDYLYRVSPKKFTLNFSFYKNPGRLRYFFLHFGDLWRIS